MTSRERLLTALRRGRPDRVPVTLYEYGPHLPDWPAREPSYAPLLELEREHGDSIVWWPGGFDVFFDPRGLRAEVTTQADGTRVTRTTAHTPRGPLWRVERRDPGLMTAWTVEPFIKSDADIERVLSLADPPVRFDAEAWRAAERRIGGAGLLALNPGDALGHVVGLFRFEDFVRRCRIDDGPIRALLARAQERLVRAMRVIGQAAHQAPVRLWGPEYCGAPLMNPRKYFERYVVEPDRELTRVIHESGNFSVLHCHGRLRDLLDYFLALDADALEPLELLPMPTADVTLPELKQRLGGRMCLMGAVQARTLECGTADEMRAEVRTAIRAAADAEGVAGHDPPAGFVLLPTSAPFMVPLTPRCLENARAMFAAARP